MAELRKVDLLQKNRGMIASVFFAPFFSNQTLTKLKPFPPFRCILTINPTITREKEPIFRIFLYDFYCGPSTGINSEIKG